MSATTCNSTSTATTNCMQPRAHMVQLTQVQCNIMQGQCTHASLACCQLLASAHILDLVPAQSGAQYSASPCWLFMQDLVSYICMPGCSACLVAVHDRMDRTFLKSGCFLAGGGNGCWKGCKRRNSNNGLRQSPAKKIPVWATNKGERAAAVSATAEE